MFKLLKRFKQRERGQAMVEYVLIIALIGLITATGFATLGKNIQTTVGKASNPVASDDTVTQGELDRIEVLNNYSKKHEKGVAVKVNEFSDIQVQAVYKQGEGAEERVDIEFADLTFYTDGVDISNEGRYTVDVSYVDKTTTFDVEVVDLSGVYWWYDSTNTTLHFSHSEKTSNYKLMPKALADFTNQPYYRNKESITTVVIDDMIKPTSTAFWFYYFTGLTAIDGIDKLDTSDVTDMHYMFLNCKSLTSLDLSNFDTSNVTRMSYMFRSCGSLTSLDVSSFNTSKVTTMYLMFGSCKSLTTLTLGDKFDTSEVTTMYQMFYGCSSLESLDLSSFNTSNVTNMSGMFEYCDKLTSLNLLSFNTSNVTDMSEMFCSCKALTALNLSSFNTSSVKTMEELFYSCSTLATLTLGNEFDVSSDTSMKSMFYSCSKLKQITIPQASWGKIRSTGGTYLSATGWTETVIDDVLSKYTK